MSSSTKRVISHNPTEIELRQSRASRLNRNHLGTCSVKFSNSKEAKFPKIVKSSSSTEKPKLNTLYIPDKGIPKFSKIVMIVIVKVNNHLKCPFEIHQIYPQELKGC
jgi:hypothetical protein